MSYIFVRFCIDRPRSLFSYLVVWQLCFLPSIVITSLGGEGASHSAGRLLVCPHYVSSRFSTLHPRWCQRRAVNLDCGTPQRSFHFLLRNLIMQTLYQYIVVTEWIIRIAIEHPLWLTDATLDSENVFLFYDVIDIPCNKFLN